MDTPGSGPDPAHGCSLPTPVLDPHPLRPLPGVSACLQGRGRALQKTSRITSLPSSKPFHGSPCPWADREPLAPAYSSSCLASPPSTPPCRPPGPTAAPGPLGHGSGLSCPLPPGGLSRTLCFVSNTHPVFSCRPNVPSAEAESLTSRDCVGSRRPLSRPPAPLLCLKRLRLLCPRSPVLRPAQGLLVPVAAQCPAQNRNSVNTA